MGRMVDPDHTFGELLRYGDVSVACVLPLRCSRSSAGYANFVVMGYFKDISADRETGYRTFPVAFGWRANAFYGDITALVAAVLTAWVVVLVGWNVLAVLTLALAVWLQLGAQLAVHRTRDEHAVGKPIADGVRALVLYCLAIVLALRMDWALFAVVFYGAFELVLKARPERGQV